MSTDNWNTPKWLADALGPFDLDPCSNETSHIKMGVSIQQSEVTAVPPTGDTLDDLVALERRTRTVQGDGLAILWSFEHGWGGGQVQYLPAGVWSVFVNPPYSNPLPWCQKLRDHDGPWCALLKLDPSTRWWAALMQASPTVAPFRKRLKFEGDKSMTANFPSVLVYSAWRPPAALVPHLWLQTWAVAA
jgi:hypothetical protein